MGQYEENQKKLHRCHLILLAEIKRICEKHNIRYFAIAGTLLGAVRHTGFIPWDDDMDIGMLREDYERFLSVAKEELDSRMFLQNFETDEKYALPFTKLMLRGTLFEERSAVSSSAEKCIYVDVFPLDNAPDSEEERAAQDKKTYLLRRLLLAKLGYKVYESHETKKKIVYTMLKLFTLFISRKALVTAIENEIRKYNTIPTENVVNIGGAYGYKKEMLRKSWFDTSAELPFEDTTIAAPGAYKDYLTYFYGDYMTPPPENKRGDRHNVVNLDFGPYAG